MEDQKHLSVKVGPLWSNLKPSRRTLRDDKLRSAVESWVQEAITGRHVFHNSGQYYAVASMFSEIYTRADYNKASVPKPTPLPDLSLLDTNTEGIAVLFTGLGRVDLNTARIRASNGSINKEGLLKALFNSQDISVPISDISRLSSRCFYSRAKILQRMTSDSIGRQLEHPMLPPTLEGIAPIALGRRVQPHPITKELITVSTIRPLRVSKSILDTSSAYEFMVTGASKAVGYSLDAGSYNCNLTKGLIFFKKVVREADSTTGTRIPPISEKSLQDIKLYNIIPPIPLNLVSGDPRPEPEVRLGIGLSDLEHQLIAKGWLAMPTVTGSRDDKFNHVIRLNKDIVKIHSTKSLVLPRHKEPVDVEFISDLHRRNNLVRGQ